MRNSANCFSQRITFFVIIMVIFIGSCKSETGEHNWNLVWFDEFNGTTLDLTKWNYEVGNGYGSGELEYYTSWDQVGNQNVTIINDEGESVLRVSALNDPPFIDPDEGSFTYTSGRLTTQGKYSFTHGKIEARIKLPKGRGMFPALWLLGNTISTNGIGWPRCGEIDIMEMIGGSGYTDFEGLSDSVIYGTLHWGDGDNTHFQSEPNGSISLEKGIFADGYHIFSVEWNKTKISWLLDGSEYFSENIPVADYDAFQEPFFIIVNLAIGGDWPGPPDATTLFPQHLYVDWIRVYQ